MGFEFDFGSVGVSTHRCQPGAEVHWAGWVFVSGFVRSTCLRRLVRRIRQHWPTTHMTIRGDGHYGRPEVLAWCEDTGIDYVFGLPGNAVLARAVDAAADDIRTRRALDGKPSLRGFAETRYQAGSWATERRVCARKDFDGSGVVGPGGASRTRISGLFLDL